MHITSVLTLGAAALLAATPVLSHELWIEPLDFQPAATVPVEAHLVNGQNFEGLLLPFLPYSNEVFTLTLGDETRDVENRIGSKPALNSPALGEGLHIAVYQSKPATVTYATLDKFASFVTHKDLGPAITRHKERGLSEEGFSEVYTRFSKSLIGVGDAAGTDRNFGLETELVALSNPYADDVTAGLPVQLFYQGKPRPEAQVELFARSPDGTVKVTLHRTDAQGMVLLPVRPLYTYMADAVVLREPQGEQTKDAVWESLWANLTFALPGR